MQFFGKTMGNVRKHKVLKEEGIIYYQNQTIKQEIFFPENILAIEIRKIQILMNKPVYLGLSIPKVSIIVMYEFWYDYLRPKYGEKAKL